MHAHVAPDNHFPQDGNVPVRVAVKDGSDDAVALVLSYGAPSRRKEWPAARLVDSATAFAEDRGDRSSVQAEGEPCFNGVPAADRVAKGVTPKHVAAARTLTLQRWLLLDPAAITAFAWNLGRALMSPPPGSSCAAPAGRRTAAGGGCSVRAAAAEHVGAGGVSQEDAPHVVLRALRDPQRVRDAEAIAGAAASAFAFERATLEANGVPPVECARLAVAQGERAAATAAATQATKAAARAAAEQARCESDDSAYDTKGLAALRATLPFSARRLGRARLTQFISEKAANDAAQRTIPLLAEAACALRRLAGAGSGGGEECSSSLGSQEQLQEAASKRLCAEGSAGPAAAATAEASSMERKAIFAAVMCAARWGELRRDAAAAKGALASAEAAAAAARAATAEALRALGGAEAELQRMQASWSSEDEEED